MENSEGRNEEEEEEAMNVSLAAGTVINTARPKHIDQIDNKYTKLKELEKKRMKATFDKSKKFSNKDETKYQDFKNSIAML